MDKKANPILPILGATVLLMAAVGAIGQGAKNGAANTTAQASPATPATTSAAPAASATTAALSDIERTFGFLPRFFTEIPTGMLPGTWEEMKGLQLNKGTLLPSTVKELIGLGVSAQVPCTYCLTAHREFARANGATETEIGEAVAMAAMTRQWSTFMNGMQLDETKFKKEVNSIANQAKKAMASKTPPPKPMAVTDGKSALADIKQTFGFVPEFLDKFPEGARAGAWKTMRDVEMNPHTALSGKYKSLISLAVASQIPCNYCITADKEFAKVEGASEGEINEAIAMAGFTRLMSTMLNGMKVDEGQWNADVARIAKSAQASRAPTKSAPVQTR